MNKVIKTKWINALRSGRYKQCKGRLKKGDGYCCLGVLAKVQGCKLPMAAGILNGRYSGYAAGLESHSQSKLAGLNDNDDYSFKDIATFIEKNY